VQCVFSHLSSRGQNGFPSSGIKKIAFTFASYFKDRYILTSVIFQGCLVFTMVFLGQLQVKHIPYLCKISTVKQNAVSTNTFSLQTMGIWVQSGRQCRISKLFGRAIFLVSFILYLVHHTFGMSSWQTPFSRFGGVSVSYSTSSLSHLKTVSFLVFATYKTEILSRLYGTLWFTKVQTTALKTFRV
jgi:hypothetical protein